MTIGNFITLKKGKDIQEFCLFEDGSARHMSKGIWRILDNFWEYYYSLIKNGYEEI